MAVKALTNTQINTAKPKAKEYNLADGQGLALRITPTGGKFWLFNYTKPYTKKRTNIGLGAYPAVSLADARDKRTVYRALLAKNIDPKTHKDDTAKNNENRISYTLEIIAANWFKVKSPRIKDSTATEIWRSLETHVFPTMGKMPIDTITAPIAIKTIKPVELAGSFATAKRLCQRLNDVMAFAVNTGVVHHNPLVGIRAAFIAPVSKKQPTLHPTELPRFMRALNASRNRLTTKAAIEWQLHTMTRPNEAAGAAWDEIDFDNALWTIPAERMKAGKTHIVPLSPQALAILKILKPLSGHRQFIFTGVRDLKTHIKTNSLNEAIGNMGFKGELVAHGLRALASTTLNEQGFNKDLIEVALAHGDPDKVRAAYDRATYIDRRREIMCWWSDHIEKAATGNMTVASNVIQIRAA